MSAWRVSIDEGASDQLEIIATWWAQNRPAAAGLVASEFVDVISLRAVAPLAVGSVYEPRRDQGVRRALMPRTGYHVYYRADEDLHEVRVLSIWHARRGSGPPL